MIDALRSAREIDVSRAMPIADMLPSAAATPSEPGKPRYSPAAARMPGWAMIALLLAILAIASRAQIFGDSLADSDEGFYLLVGQRMLHGALPYVDIWDRKPIGLFLLYAGMRALGGDGVLAYQLVGTVFAFLTALLVARIADRFSSRFGAAAAGAAYLAWLPLGSAAGGQAELFGNLPITVAALITLRGLERTLPIGNAPGGAAAMLLTGVALQIKPDALFAGIFLGCCWLVVAWRAGCRAKLVPLALLWCGAAVLPTLLGAGYYAARGQLDAFVYANFVSALRRHTPSPLHLLRGLSILVVILAPLLAFIRPRGPVPASGRAAFRFVLGWLAAAATGLIVYRAFSEQFLLPLLMPASAAAAPTFGRLARWRTIALLGVILALGQAELWVDRAAHGSRREAQAIVAAVDPQGCLFVYSGLAALYRMSGACIPTRFAFPSHLSRRRESGAIGVDPLREVARIMATKPATVIMRSPYHDENWPARAEVLRAVARDYRLVRRQKLGWQKVSIYRLDQTPAGCRDERQTPRCGSGARASAHPRPSG